MSVTTGSLGTANVPASNPSLDGLDRVNFFLAAMLAGFGPYVAAYLANANWPQAEIGLVLSAGSVAALLSQLPGGELLDKIRFKRAVIAVGTGIVIVSALILAFWPRLPFVFIGLVLQGVTGGFLGPAIAAISLGLVGHSALAERLGRNQRFASTGALVLLSQKVAAVVETNHVFGEIHFSACEGLRWVCQDQVTRRRGFRRMSRV
jgi:MFS family permease